MLLAIMAIWTVNTWVGGREGLHQCLRQKRDASQSVILDGLDSQVAGHRGLIVQAAVQAEVVIATGLTQF